MKAFLAAVILAALATSSAYAHKVTPNRAGGSSHLVYAPDGTVIGQDVDPNVRLQMRRDYGSWEF